MSYRDVLGKGGKGKGGRGKGGKGPGGAEDGADEWAADVAGDQTETLNAAEDRVSDLEHAARAATQAYKERSTPLLAQRRDDAKAELEEAKAVLAAKRDACRVPEDRQVSIHNKIKRLLADKNKAFEKAKKAYEAMHEAESTLDAARSDHRKAEAKIADLQRESDAIRDAQRAAAEATPAPEDTAAKATADAAQWEALAVQCISIRDNPPTRQRHSGRSDGGAPKHGECCQVSPRPGRVQRAGWQKHRTGKSSRRGEGEGS